jgi:hypothetical protein
MACATESKLERIPTLRVNAVGAGSAALPRNRVRLARPGAEVGVDHRPTSNRLACDVCGNARTRDERLRLVWESDPASRLVLAELCRDCATFADPLLELYGGCGREAISLVQEVRASTPRRTVRPRVFGYAAGGVLYLLIGVVSFLLVTLVTSRGR